MKKNKKIAVIILLVGIIGLICIYFFTSNNDDELNASDEISTDIAYDESDEIPDFSDCKEQTINLDDESGKINITDYGVYILSGNLKGYINIDTDKNVKIILKNATITSDNGPAIYVANAKNVYLEIEGTNEVTDSSSYSDYDEGIDSTIYSHDDLILFGTGKLTVNAKYADGITSADDLKFISGSYTINSEDDAIKGKDSVVIKEGTYVINSSGDAIKATETDDTTKGYILIQGGTFTIDSVLDGLQAETKILINGGEFTITTGGGSSVTSKNSSWGSWGTTSSSSTTESAKAIKASSNIVISDGTFEINSSDDAIHSNDSIGIKGGTFNISSGDDGIHADTTLIIDDGKIDINKSYEGLESSNVTINGGDISVVASDDGINVAGGADSSSIGGRPGENNFAANSNCTLTINGGSIYVNSAGDGLDSNGAIIMNDGNVIVDGPTDDGNGPLDYDSSFTMNGGFLVAAGSSGMAQNISAGTSYGVMVNFTSTMNAGTIINIDGVITYSPAKNFSSIVVVSPNLLKGSTYTVSYGGTSTGTKTNGLYTSGTYSGGSSYKTFTISSTATTIGTSNNRPMGRG